MKIYQDPQLVRWVSGNRNAFDSLAEFERLYFDGDEKDFIKIYVAIGDNNDIRMRNNSVAVGDESIKPSISIHITVRAKANLESDVWDMVPDLVSRYNDGKHSSFKNSSVVVVRNSIGGIPDQQMVTMNNSGFFLGMPRIDFVFDADKAQSEFVGSMVRVRYANLPAMWYPESVPTQTTRDGVLKFQRHDQFGYKYVHDLEGQWHSSFRPTQYTLWIGEFLGSIVAGGTQKLAERMALQMLGDSFGLDGLEEIEAVQP